MLLLQTELVKLAREGRDPTIGSYLHIPTIARVRSVCGSAATKFLAALYDTRRRQAAHTLLQHRHLIETANTELEPESTS